MKYEIIFIVRSDLEDKKREKVITDFAKILTKNKVKVLTSKEMGQKTLAYEIKKQKSGYYFVYEVEIDDVNAVKEINRLLQLNENIIRHMIIKLDS